MREKTPPNWFLKISRDLEVEISAILPRCGNLFEAFQRVPLKHTC